MKKRSKSTFFFKEKKRYLIKLLFFYSLFVFAVNANAQEREGNILQGVVLDDEGETLIGVNVAVEGTSSVTATDINGEFSILAPATAKVLKFSYVGMKPVDQPIGENRNFKVIMSYATEVIQEAVVVGYAVQKKASVVGAISQVGSNELKRTGGVTNLAQTLTGALPGVTTMQVTGMPGEDDPKILIRGKSTWNNSEPLILVDGVERRMNDIDVNEVESVSILKDASATAVYGVKGAEGVILITTKRGKEGKPRFSFNTQQTIKIPSTIHKKMNSYDALSYQNLGIERELPVTEGSWEVYTPQAILEKYKRPYSDPDDQYIYPDVDWANEMLKDYAHSHQYNLNVAGGTSFAKYFGSLSYMKEGDILKTGENVGTSDKTEYSYERYNYRTNIDFDITPTTLFSVNLAGYLGTRKSNDNDYDVNVWRGLYMTGPSNFPVRFPDGEWGYTPKNLQTRNPVYYLNQSGTKKQITSQMNTDFILQQKLDFITKGLSFRGSFSYDTRQQSKSTTTPGGYLLQKYIDPVTKEVHYAPLKGIREFDYNGSYRNYNFEEPDLDAPTQRRIYYQLQLNYARNFQKHEVGATAVMTREQYTSGDEFPHYREDWVGRVTYNYDQRYLFETNGAYNGSEKFGPGYRFGFFPSLAVGWNISNESFLQSQQRWLDKLKIRASIGKVGNDSFDSGRWPYRTYWGAQLNPYNNGPDWASYNIDGYDQNNTRTPYYYQYVEGKVGNPDLQWEEVLKQNLGIELSLFNLLSVNFDVFKDRRSKVFIVGRQRQGVMDYFGTTPVAANLGKTKSQGFELELSLRKTTRYGLYYWATYSLTHVKDEVIKSDSSPLLPDYQKSEGYAIDQTRTYIGNGFLTSWDDVYAYVSDPSYKANTLPGDLIILDFNGDGIIDDKDRAPYGYTDRPQNVYNISGGVEYKNWSFMVQFYGVYNTTRWFDYPSELGKSTGPVVSEFFANYWSPGNQNASWSAPRAEKEESRPYGDLNMLDGSYLRLKNIQLGYTLKTNWLNSFGIENVKFLLSGNNLLFWSDLPEDREESQSMWSSNSYPNLKRVTLGINVNF